MTGPRRDLSTADKNEASSAASAERRIADLALFDPSRPNVARVYDYWLGGKDNYAADRAEAQGLISAYPRLPLLVRQGRLFLAKAVRWLAEQGARQFLDLGCGLPTGHDVHDIARSVDRDSRVVYVDSDSIVLSHARAIFRDPGVTVMRGNLAEPGDVLATLREWHPGHLGCRHRGTWMGASWLALPGSPDAGFSFSVYVTGAPALHVGLAVAETEAV